MLGRRVIGAFFAVVLIIAVVTFVLGYLLLRPLFYGETTDLSDISPFASENAIRAIVDSVDASVNAIQIATVDDIELIAYSSNTHLDQLGGSPMSVNQIYQCAIVTATGRVDGTTFIADQISILPSAEATVGTFRADVIVDTADLLPIPDPRVTPLTSLTRGMRLDLLGRCKNWIAVIAPGGTHGWVEREFIDLADDQLNRLPWLPLDPARLRP